MNPSRAPGTSWEVRLRWGSRRLAAELLGPERRQLRLGDQRGDDVDTGSAARLEFTLDEGGALALHFSTGVTGEVSLGGRPPAPLGSLAEQGPAAEGAPGPAWRLVLRGDDRAALQVGALAVDVRRARGRLLRLPADRRVLLAAVLALLAVGLVLGSVMAPHPGPNPRWVSPRRR